MKDQKVPPEVWYGINARRAIQRIVPLLENTTGWDDMHLREFAKDALS